ncbi:hypothetical protein [Desertivirga arenae]|uniref:hypothetical protein n=1 Tax=Desertivirga arenae TaxID=2810309 RepID=UPI001A972880|nr:hypothetical protein [Pedobacter sp. SYSU D00823]
MSNKTYYRLTINEVYKNRTIVSHADSSDYPALRKAVMDFVHGRRSQNSADGLTENFGDNDKTYLLLVDLQIFKYAPSDACKTAPEKVHWNQPYTKKMVKELFQALNGDSHIDFLIIYRTQSRYRRIKRYGEEYERLKALCDLETVEIKIRENKTQKIIAGSYRL